ncbi:ABC transporter ATP-binding protein/permease [Candidatus Saccharibacteria bacterium]|nr:ABC transporter ATP-binding protein/permease [Candidatus Saccharibacteria bacterium]
MAENPPVRRQPNRGPMGGGPVAMTVEKPKDFKKSMGRLLKTLKPHRIGVAAVVLLTILATGLAIIGPKILGNMTNQIVDDFISVRTYDTVWENLPDGVELPVGTTIKDLPELMKNLRENGRLSPETVQKMAESRPANFDEMFDKVPSAQRELIENLDLSRRPEFHFDKLAAIGMTLIILFLIAAAANYISGWLMTGVTQKVVRELRRTLSEKINRLPISYFDRLQYGQTLSRVTNDVDTIGQTMNQAAGQAISAVIMIIGVMAMMILISWLLALVAIGVITVSALTVGFVTKRSQKYFSGVQNHLGELSGHIEENYAGHTIIKAFSAEERIEQQFSLINQQLYASAWRSQFMSGLMMPLMHFISNLGYVATAVLGGWLALNGRLSIGDIQAFFQYVNQMQQPITQIGQIANLLQSAAAAAERVFEFLDEPDEVPDAVDAITLTKIKGEIEFKNINFSYEPGEKIIKGFSAHIKPGQKVAIVGPTGAGKTTIINLLMRFYDIDSGQILIDGVDTRKMKRSAVRQLFGMVLQDTWLISSTIEENLRYGKLDASDDEIKQAAIAAHVDHFVKSLPHSYQTKIDEDSENISMGERQLLTIARAMVADAPMMILDEATSSVDTRTEMLIQQAMEKLMKGRTSFVIAHRLSTIINSDLILVMKDGNIIEQGTHRSLLAADGFYAQLYNSQFAE